MNTSYNFTKSTLIALILLSLTACGGGGDGSKAGNQLTEQSIAFAQAGPLDMTMGETKRDRSIFPA